MTESEESQHGISERDRDSREIRLEMILHSSQAEGLGEKNLRGAGACGEKVLAECPAESRAPEGQKAVLDWKEGNAQVKDRGLLGRAISMVKP